MSEAVTNVLTTVLIMPVSNEMQIGGSILPDRFTSISKEQVNPILGGDLGSTSAPIRSYGEIIYPIFVGG
jgi:hypothetical protein